MVPIEQARVRNLYRGRRRGITITEGCGVDGALGLSADDDLLTGHAERSISAMTLSACFHMHHFHRNQSDFNEYVEMPAANIDELTLTNVIGAVYDERSTRGEHVGGGGPDSAVEVTVFGTPLQTAGVVLRQRSTESMTVRVAAGQTLALADLALLGAIYPRTGTLFARVLRLVGVRHSIRVRR